MTQADQSAAVLEAANVSYAYGSFWAVSRVSLHVQAGELVALIGRNGAGKSTLLRCLAGWTPVRVGEVRVLGLPVARAERAIREHVVLVPDTPPFYDELSAWEQLQFVAQVGRLLHWRDRAEELLRRFGLWSQRQALPLAFSRGMRYKLALCLSLLVAPHLLLLDEPFGPLDPVSADRLWDDLCVYRDTGMGILLSSHQLPVLRLRWRHTQEALIYWVRSGLYYDPRKRTTAERLYGLYLLVLIVVVFLLPGWVELLATAAAAGYALSPHVRGRILDALPAAILCWQVVLAMLALRSSPLKLTYPDMAYVAGAPLPRGAAVLIGFLFTVTPRLLVAMLMAGLVAVALTQPATVGSATRTCGEAAVGM